MPLHTTPFDPADYLPHPEDQAGLLEDAFAEGHPGYIANSLGTVARARGITQLSAEQPAELSLDGNPPLTTLLAVTRALGYRLALIPIAPKA